MKMRCNNAWWCCLLRLCLLHGHALDREAAHRGWLNCILGRRVEVETHSSIPLSVVRLRSEKVAVVVSGGGQEAEESELDVVVN